MENTGILVTIIISIVLLTLFLAGIVFVIRSVRRNRRTGVMDEMEGHEFEYFCADLLEKQGFVDVEVTRGSGDFGVDILAEKDGVTYAVQCKRYHGTVGVDAVLRTYAGRDYYGCMVGAVMTNQYFTAPAVEAAEKLHILLWDRGYVDDVLAQATLIIRAFHLSEFPSAVLASIDDAAGIASFSCLADKNSFCV